MPIHQARRYFVAGSTKEPRPSSERFDQPAPILRATHMDAVAGDVVV